MKKKSQPSNARTRRKGKRQSRAPSILAVIILAVVIVAAVVLFLIWPKDRAETDGDSTTVTGTGTDVGTVTEAETEEMSETVTEEPLPEIENSSSLALSSVYTSSILNPDSGDEYAEEVASLEVTNGSDQYLESATLTATMSDGTEVQFVISDLPSGATAEIFDTANQSMDSGVNCISLVCTSEEYLDGEMLMSDVIEITADGSSAVITNTGSEDLTGLTVIYHCDMAGQYFGGTSYTTTIENLAAGESFTLSDDTLMGEIAVVRVYQ